MSKPQESDGSGDKNTAIEPGDVEAEIVENGGAAKSGGSGLEPWNDLEARIDLFVNSHMQSQRQLAALMEDQMKFLRKMKTIAAAEQHRGQPGSQKPRGGQHNPQQPQQPSSGRSQDVKEEQDSAPVGSQQTEEKGEMSEKDYEEKNEAKLQATRNMFSESDIMARVPVKFNFIQATRMTTSISRPVQDLPLLKDGKKEWAKAVARVIISMPLFEPLMGLVIILNALCIGFAINYELAGEDSNVFEALEHPFLLIYIFELVLRFTARGRRCFRDGWVVLDLMLVAIGAGSTYVAKPILKGVENGDSALIKSLQQILIFRMIRLLRLVRALRLVTACKSLWKLVQGLINSCGTMVSTMLLLFVTLYIFACIGAELITKELAGDPDPKVAMLIKEDFATIPTIMLTLVQFITMDSIAGFYVPLIKRKPSLAFYFLMLLVLVSIALMNLVTALVVEDAISSARMDEEMETFYARKRLKKLRPVIRSFFRQLDASGDELIQIREIVDAMKNGVLIPPELRDILTPANMLDLFDALDLDGSGELSETEFTEGLCHLALADVPMETTQVLHLLRTSKREITRTQGCVEEMLNTPLRAWTSLDEGQYAGKSMPSFQNVDTLTV